MVRLFRANGILLAYRSSAALRLPFVPPPMRAHEVSQLVGDIQVGLRNLVFAEIPLPQSVIAAMGKLDELLLEMSTYSESWEE